MVSLLDQTRELARREGKIPVLMLATKGRPGFVLAIDAHDLAAVAAELAVEIPADTPTPPMPPTLPFSFDPGPDAA